MRNICSLVRKDVLLFLNDRAAVALTFAVPIVLTFIFGNVFGGGSDSGPSGIRLLVVDQVNSSFSQQIVSKLDESDAFRVIRETETEAGMQVLDPERCRELIEEGKARYALILPEAEGMALISMRLLYDPVSNIEYQMVEGLIQKTVFLSLGDPGGDNTGVDTDAPGGDTQDSASGPVGDMSPEERSEFLDSLAGTVSEHFNLEFEPLRENMETTVGRNGLPSFQDLIVIDREQLVGKEISSPGATQSVGGWAMMFLMFSMTGAASSLFDEKKAGLFVRLLSGPVSRTDILWSKFLFMVLLGCIQLFVLFTAGWLMFGIDIWSNFGNLALVSIAAVTAATGLGMILCALSRTPAQANGYGTLIILTMSALGGAMFPRWMLPEFMQALSWLTIPAWAMEGYHGVLWRGHGLAQILPFAGVLFLIAACTLGIAIPIFRRGAMFR